MPLPAVPPQVIEELLKPAARRIAAGLLTLVDAALRGQSKSTEEMLLDAVAGEAAANDRRIVALQRIRQLESDPGTEYQRALARAAIRYVPPAHFVMPALSIAGKIFRESEFDQTEAPIWEMWVQLLARACDKDRVGDARPSFPWLISQLSSDEARLLAALALLHPRSGPPFDNPIPVIESANVGVVFPENLGFYLGHLGSLGLLILPMGSEPTGHVVMIDHIRTYMLTDFGRSFISAVSCAPSRGA